MRPLRTLDRGGLRRSIARELERLLNATSSLPARELEGREATVIDYGIPDFSTFFPKSHADRARLARLIQRAVEAFEPRLRRVRVRLEPAPHAQLALVGAIEGMLVVDGVAEPVSFPTVFQADRGEVEVDAHP